LPTRDVFQPPSAFYFRVSFTARGRNVDAAFREVGGIGPEMETETVSEGGENRFVHTLPKAVKHPRLVLKRGIAPFDSPLVQWCKSVLEDGLAQPIKPQQLLVVLMDEAGQPLRNWNIQNAYPVRWEIEPFQSTKNEVAIEKIDLCYAYSTRKN
jgi:phage tail-like protein